MMSRAKSLMPLLLPLLLSACALGQIGAVAHPTVSGGVEVKTGDVMARWNPDRCVSGDRSYFLGFEFRSGTDSQALRAWREPGGETVALWTSDRGSITLHASDCDRLELDVHPTGWRVNEVREFAGSTEMSCRLPQGTLEARLSVDHCH
jgi:hypothetical protein